MDPVETYTRELLDIHRSGQAVKETSYYGPLANLLNEIGRALKPRVHCIINIKNRGAGLPDGGLFTSDQLQMPNSPPHSFLLVVPSRSKAQAKIFAGLPPANKYCATWADMDKYWSPTTAISYSSGEMLMRNL